MHVYTCFEPEAEGGVALIAAFGVGFGAVLAMIACGLVIGRRLMRRTSAPTRFGRGAEIGRWLVTAGPVIASLVLLASGAVLAGRALTDL